jgi:hypothetical protein
MTGHISSPESRHVNRSASRPQLPARSNTGPALDISRRPDVIALAASRGRLALRWECAFRSKPVRSAQIGAWNLVFGIWSFSASAASPFHILNPSSYAHHISRFNSMEDENVTNFVSNAKSWDWLVSNIPLLDCPNPEIQEIYYFRWWSFRKHIVQTTNGFVLTEFLTPMRHAGAFNTISCAVGHHLAEGPPWRFLSATSAADRSGGE